MKVENEKSKSTACQCRLWLLIPVAIALVGITIGVDSIFGISAPAKQYLSESCNLSNELTSADDWVSLEVCVVLNAIKYDGDNWKVNEFGMNNTRLHFGVWLGNSVEHRNIYYGTGSGAHITDGKEVTGLNSGEKKAIIKATDEFLILRKNDARGQFRNFVLKPQ